jgi:cation transport regulator ChaB
MPYSTLPARLRRIIPSADGQELFRNVVNSQLKAGKSESVAMASAWAALQEAGYKKTDGAWVKKDSGEALRNKVEEYNEKYGDKHGKVTLGMLRDVYDRGVGAYRTNPSSVRPNVTSPEQWAMARVNSFLSAARGAKAINHDKDIHDKISKSSPTVSSVHVPSTDWDKQETYRAPAGARAAARRAIRWKEKYGDEVKGGTQVGWTRAGQLARGENLSRSTVARMSAFARHRQNSSVDPKFKDTPWKDRGHVAWLIWGGDAGVNWANATMDRINKRQIDDDSFTMPDEARSRSMEMGLEGEIHVHQADGQQAVYMPGKTHEDYLSSLERLAGIEPEPDDESEGLLERAISAIIGGVMTHENIHKSGTVTILKADDEQRIVYGWAYVSTEDGRLLVDSQGDSIEPEEMVKMADNFMLDVRKAKAMHRGEVVGEFIHSMPLTNELMKAFDIHSDREGWMVALKLHSDEAWDDVKSGKLPMLSIGGRSGEVEEYDAA